MIGHIELADDGVPVPVPGTEPEHEDARSDDPPDISSLEDTADPVAAEPEEPGEDADLVAQPPTVGRRPATGAVRSCRAGRPSTFARSAAAT